jgi:uncharacterized LabA/DUF88 family protein
LDTICHSKLNDWIKLSILGNNTNSCRNDSTLPRIRLAYMSGPGYAGTRRIMIFIDGQYLRSNLIDTFGNDHLDYSKLSQALTQSAEYGSLFRMLIRTYYYDALPADEGDKHQQQKIYLNDLRDKNEFFEIRLGRTKLDGKGRQKQKGVDTLIALDMLSKAYEDHYDVAVLLTGDEDLLDVVFAVKNVGKQVYGVFFETTASQLMKDSFDRSIVINKSFLERFQCIPKQS